RAVIQLLLLLTPLAPATANTAPEAPVLAAPAALSTGAASSTGTGAIQLRSLSSNLGPASSPDDGKGTPYVVNKSDNICGLDQPRQLTNPAVVDYDALVAATPEAKKIKKDKIDPKSSEGITLMTKARARVLKACEAVRASGGHCSVWKSISRRDGKAVSNITAAVQRKL
ncbi:MAG: hypothetical protein AAFP86_22240, partial [Planctomycetota bacterium]